MKHNFLNCFNRRNRNIAWKECITIWKKWYIFDKFFQELHSVSESRHLMTMSGCLNEWSLMTTLFYIYCNLCLNKGNCNFKFLFFIHTDYKARKNKVKKKGDTYPKIFNLEQILNLNVPNCVLLVLVRYWK